MPALKFPRQLDPPCRSHVVLADLARDDFEFYLLEAPAWILTAPHIFPACCNF